MIEFLRIGVVTSPHGIRGEVKVYVTTDDISRFRTVKNITLSKDGARREAVIEHARPFKDMMIVKLSGVPDRNAAELLRNAELLIHRSQSAPLAENEFFIGDLIGMEVVTEDGSVVGELTDVLKTGANDVYEVRTTDGGSLLLPKIPDCILKGDLEKNQLTVRIPEGL